MYTFDTDLDHAFQTYDIVHQAYQKIFDQLDIPVIKGWWSSFELL
jgi:hypothetical protein